MAIVSDVEIRLRADIARLQQDMDRARQSVSSTMDRITSVAKGAMAGLAAIGGVGLFAGFIKSAIDATDAISDVSQRTGIAVEDLAGLQLWFQKGGMEADALEGSMIKLSRSIAANSDDLKRLGISTRDANGNVRSSTAVLLDAADAFSKMEDGTAKTALAVEVFGKSGAQLLPMLNEGSEGLREMNEMAEKLGLTFDQKTVDAAGDFNDTLDFMGLAAQGLGRQVAAQLLPTLNSLVGTMLNFITKGDGIKQTANVIATGFKAIYTAGVGISTLFNVVAETIAGSLAFIGNNLATFFSALKQAIEGNYSDAWRTLTSGGAGAATILKSTYTAVSTSISNAAATVGDAWTESGGEAVAAMAALNRGSRGAVGATAEQKKEAEKMAEAYAALRAQVEARVNATEREAMGLGKLSEAEQFEIDLTEQLAKGKIKLTAEQERYLRSRNAEAGANAVVNKSQKEYDDLLQKLADNGAKLDQERAAWIASAREEAEENEFLAETFGKSEAAVIRLRAARMLEQEAQRLGRELTADEIADLQQVIALKERSADAVAKREELEQVRDFWKSIDDTARDTFRSITDGGKDAFQRLKETAKNTFFDWLYQQTIKKWIINIGTHVDGSGAVSGIANSLGAGSGGAGGFLGNLLGGVSGGGGILGTAGNLYSAISGGMTIGGGLGTGFIGSLAGGLNGAGIGSGLTSSLGLSLGNSMASVLGPTISGAISSGLSALAAAAPWVAGAVAVFSIAKKAFGHGPKEMTGTSTLSGWINSAGGLDANMYADWQKKGGWFSSTKRGSDRLPIDAELAQGILSTYETIKTSTMDYAKALGLNADHIKNRAQGLNIAFSKDEDANKKALTDFFSTAADQVAREVLPSLDLFIKEGETASTALQRMATNAAGLEQALSVMGTTVGAVFGEVNNQSLLARERLVELAGGVQNLSAMASYFQQNILSEADRVRAVQGPLYEALESLGYASLKTTDDYKAAVIKLLESGALATEEGAKQYAGLLALAPQFKMVADYTAQLGTAAEELPDLALLYRARELQAQIMELEGNALGALAERRRMELEQTEASLRPLMERIYALQDEAAAAEKLAEATKENEDKLKGLVEGALAALGRAVQAQKEKVTTAYQATMQGLENSIKTVNATIERTGALSKALRGAITQNPGENGAARTLAARAEITAALAIARASGVLPTAESLANALAAVGADSSDDYATLAEYQRAVARTNAELEALGGLTDKELSMAEKQLKALEDQKSATTAAYEAEIKRLDDILASAQAQVDAINGVDNSVRSVEAALSAFGAALGALKSAPTAANPGSGIVGGGRTVTVEDLYREVLGRDPDAGGLAFWKNYAGDSVDQNEYLMFMKGAQDELKNRVNAPPTVATSSATMSSSSAMVSELQTLNRRMESLEVNMANTAAATGQFAAQFNQVSANGNALAVETVGTL